MPQRESLYNQATCPTCNRQTWQRLGGYIRVSGQWQQRLTCETCGHEWWRPALPYEQAFLDARQGTKPTQLTLLEDDLTP
jgi:transposase-like protein